MITWIRKASKPLLWLIVIIVIVTFAFWGDFTPAGRVTTSSVGVVDGAPVSTKDYQASLREAALEYFFSEGSLSSPGSEGEKVTQERAWHRILFLNEAKKLNINASNQELEKYLLRFQPFLSEGNFNPIIFDRFRKVILPSLGISYKDFENMLRNNLLISRVIDALTLGINIEKAKVDEQIMIEYGTKNIVVLLMNLEPNAKDIEVTDDILRQIYQSRSSQLLEPEKRSFLVAEFPFDKNNPESYLAAKDKAVNFTVSLIDENGNPIKDFSAAANQSAVSIRELHSVSADTTDENFSDIAVILDEGFKLTKEVPDSNPVQGDSAFYVIRFVSAEERKPLTFEQVRTKLEEEYRLQQALSRVFVKARSLREEILAKLKQGSDIMEIAPTENLSVEKVDNFILSEAMDTDNRDQIQIATAVAPLKSGELSQPQLFRNGIALFYITSQREPVEKEKYRSEVYHRLYTQTKNTILSEWLANTRRSGSEINLN
jgi:hypothetical protein